MTALYLEYECPSTGGEVCAGDEGSDWPNYEDTVIDFYLTKCVLDKDKADWSNAPIDVDFPVKRGDTVYVVVVRYGTGDSFSHTTGNHHIWGVFQTGEQAIAAEDEINREYKAYKGDKNQYNNEKKDWEYRPWMGYFEHLEDIEITPMLVR